MNLLFKTLYAEKCTGTHHKLAMDALRYLRVDSFEQWQKLFLSRIQAYLDGSKAPDKKFKDFRNHVYHVKDGGWGGAPTAAQTWYNRTVECLKEHDWSRAVYCAGVLSHYISDPLMPLHTAQSESESAVHRSIEWGTSRCYDDLLYTHESARVILNWTPPETAASDDWLSLLVQHGAEFAHQYYDTLIDHYDPLAGQNNPAEGLDQSSRTALGRTLGWAIKAVAFAIDQAIVDANVTPPSTRLLSTTIASITSYPLLRIRRRSKMRRADIAMKQFHRELEETGRVIEHLSPSEKEVRRLYAEEVQQVRLSDLDKAPVRKAGSNRNPPKNPANQSPTVVPFFRPPATRFFLELDSRVVDAPSIGPRTASRLHQIGILTVADLMDAHPEDATDSLDQRWITKQTFETWQQQATLMCRVPGLRGHDVQILVEVGINRPEQLAEINDEILHAKIEQWAETSQAERILRSGQVPSIGEVRWWIEATERSRKLRAA